MLYRDPQYFYLLFSVPFLLLLFIRFFRWKKKVLSEFGDFGLMSKLSNVRGAGRGWIKAAFLSIAAFLFAFALARPLWGTRMEVSKRSGLDLVVALDVSNSMRAQDIKPDRIVRAKYEVAQFIDRLKGDRIGLVAFAGAAFVQCPLTTDYGALKMYLDVLTPEAVAAQGTALGEAIRKARAVFAPGDSKKKVLVLITDGEDNAGDPLDEAKKAAAEGMIIYTLGIGTEGGVPIPLAQSGGGTVYKKDNSGNTVLTTINESVLEQIAESAGGRYFRSTGSGLELDRIYKEIEKGEKQDAKAAVFGRYNEQYEWFLGLGLLLILIEYFLSSRRNIKTVWEGRFTS